jgi:hypothetical protein
MRISSCYHVVSRSFSSENWVKLVMKYVPSVSFSVRVNGVFPELFTPTRGILQGDPSHHILVSDLR